MKKRNIWKMIVSSLLVLAPIAFGAIVWNKIPEQVAIHWGVDGVADGFGSRFTAVVLLPVILLAVHWLCILLTLWDNKKRNQSEKVIGIMYWIMPAISLYTAAITYAMIFGMQIDVLAYTAVIVGVLLAVTGNYMPKTTRNRTMGIKLKWTLASDENWNYTHRLAGKVWMICGIAMTPLAFLPVNIAIVVMFVLLFAAMIIPVIASYVYYRKQLREGALDSQARSFGKDKRGAIVGIVLPIVIVFAVCVLMVTGNIEMHYGEDRVEIEMTYHGDVAIAYDNIEKIEYREDFAAGSRVMGFGSPRLSTGTFQNEEFGNYTRYTYTGCKAAVILTVDGKKVAVNGRTVADTVAIYETLTERTAN